MAAWGQGLIGLGSGAATGAMMGSAAGPMGTAIGGVAGGLIGGIGGFLSGNAREDAAAAQQRAIDAAMSRLQEGAKQQYSDRMSAMDKVLGFYQPSQDVLTRLYGGTRPQGSGPPAPAPVPAMPAQGQAQRPPQQPPGFPPVGPGASPGMSRLGF
jgi:hypothetical protein